ncbi:MAG: hypothetical protein ABJC66_11165 [Gammaproteobacteria bacterium]
MKTLILVAALVAVAAPAMAGDVGVAISINQPGFYGQINIGDVPQPPQLIYTQPLIIQRDATYAVEPIYLHVPPGHEKHWAKHCAQYNACGRPVYFVRDDWYTREYAPRHQPRRDDKRDDEGHEHGKKHGHGHGHDD